MSAGLEDGHFPPRGNVMGTNQGIIESEWSSGHEYISYSSSRDARPCDVRSKWFSPAEVLMRKKMLGCATSCPSPIAA